MSDSSGRGAEFWQGEGYAHLDRELWGAVIAALHCADQALRLEVLEEVIAAGSPAWDEDLDAPEVLAELLDRFRLGPRPAGTAAVVAALRWSRTPPRLATGDAR